MEVTLETTGTPSLLPDSFPLAAGFVPPAASWSPFPKLLFFHCVFSPSMGTHHFDLPSPGAVGHQMRSGAALGSSSRSLACLLSHSSDVPLGQANPSLPWQERYKTADQNKGDSKQWKGSLGFHGLSANGVWGPAEQAHDPLVGHGETPRGIYNKMVGIRLIKGWALHPPLWWEKKHFWDCLQLVLGFSKGFSRAVGTYKT